MNIEPVKNKRRTLVITAAIIIILILSGSIYTFIYNNPKTKVLRGLTAANSEIEKNTDLLETIVGTDFSKALDEKGFNETMELTLNSSNVPQIESFKNSGINFNLSYDQNNKKMLFDMGAKYKGNTLANAKFYTDNNKLMLSVPQLYNAWFTCDAENIQEQFNSSPLSSNGKMPEDAVSFKLFSEDNTKVLTGQELAKAVIKGYKATNADKLKSFEDSIKIEKSDKTKALEIGGTSQECTGYNVTITGDAAKTFIMSITDYMLTDPEIKKIITKSAEYSYLQQPGQYESPQAISDKIYSDLKENNEKLKQSLSIDTVNAVVYLDKKGRAVSMDLDTALTYENNKTQMKYSYNLQGKDNLADLINGSIEMTSDGEQSKLNFESSTVKTDADITQKLSFNTSDSSDTFKFTETTAYNKNSGGFTVTGNADSSDAGLTFSLSGKSSFDKGSNKLDLSFDKIDLNSSGTNVSLAGKFSIGALSAPIEEPADTELEVFKLNESELTNVQNEIQNNINKLIAPILFN